MSNQNTKQGSLVVVGSGIKFLSHLTTEAKAYLEQSEKVLYLLNDPLMKEWLCQLNPAAESLDRFYQQFELRKDCYQAITHHILDTVRSKQHVCTLLYGHPAVFAQPGLEAVRMARHEGYFAKVLPGISAEDCLFADLLIDPGVNGCQSFEATDFLAHRRQFDPRSYLILWQVDWIDALNFPPQYDNSAGIKKLIDYLSASYKPHHDIIIYEAAQYPGLEPTIQKISLNQLQYAKLTAISTLCVPPNADAAAHKRSV
jgi:tetrapyrrole methylase family protein/MazG family protein